MAEEDFNHSDRSNELSFWCVLQAHQVMAEFVKETFTGNPKFNPQMLMFILETMFPQVDLESVSTACANFSALNLTVQNLASSVGTFDSCLRALEDTSSL